MWDAVAGAPAKDRQKFRDELLWQEHFRHLCARFGHATKDDLQFDAPVGTGPWEGEPWPERMVCSKRSGVWSA